MLCGNADQEFEEPSPAIFLATIQELEEDGLRSLQQIVKGKRYDEGSSEPIGEPCRIPFCNLSAHRQHAFHHGPEILFLFYGHEITPTLTFSSFVMSRDFPLQLPAIN
jgi:hypothetical protein